MESGFIVEVGPTKFTNGFDKRDWGVEELRKLRQFQIILLVERRYRIIMEY